MHQEIKEVFGCLKNMIEAHRDMGFDPPHIRPADFPFLGNEGAEEHDHSPSPDNIDSLEALIAYVSNCRGCKLHKQRRNLVFGEGNHNASLVFVGEAPGKDEDHAGRPFVGEAGKLLTRIIENGMGLSRNDVYILNVVKCHPPKNRDPEQDEIETCIHFLRKQISLIKPKVICGLGRIAGQAMLGGDFKISRDRGKWFSYMDIPVLATFHPAYVLRYPTAKRQVWDDVKEIMRHLGLEVKKND
jgi:uracil-DNA glycosylase